MKAPRVRLYSAAEVTQAVRDLVLAADVMVGAADDVSTDLLPPLQRQHFRDARKSLRRRTKTAAAALAISLDGGASRNEP